MKQGRTTALTIFGAALTAAMIAASPARATGDGFVKVLLPLEELINGGYCQQEVIAYDAMVTAPDALGNVIANVFVRPVNAYVYQKGPNKRDSLDLNPFSLGPSKLTIKIESPEDGSKIYKIAAGIARAKGKPAKAGNKEAETIIKLAFLYALRNLFTWEEDAKIFFSVEGSALPDGKTRQLLTAGQPHTRTSPAYIELGKELDSKWCSNIKPDKSWSK